MVKENNRKQYAENKYADPFQSPRANAKHAWAQINGETQQGQNDIILQRETRKRS